MQEINQKVYISLFWQTTTSSIFVYNTVTNILSQYDVSSQKVIYGIGYDAITQRYIIFSTFVNKLIRKSLCLKINTFDNQILFRIIFGGKDSTNNLSLVIMWSAISLLEYHPDISIKINSINPTSTLTLQTTASSSLNPVMVTITGGSVSGNIKAIDSQPSYNFQSDIYLMLDTKDLGLIPSCIQKIVVLDLTWSLSGLTAISHILISDPSSPPPSWVTLDASTGVVSLTTPNVTAATPFQFYVQSKVDGDSNTYVKLIKLTVAAYVYTKKQPTDEVNAAIYLTQAVMAIGAVLSISKAVLSFSSPQSMWMICNQFQLLLLLPLTNAFIPEDVVNYFTGNHFINFNFNSVPIVESPVSRDFTDYFGNDQNNDSLQNLGAVYKRSILNHISLLTLIAFVVFVHVVSFVPKLWLKKSDSDKCCYKAYSKWMRFLTFAVYVRLLVEALQAIFVSSLSELKIFSTANTAHRLSLSFAFVLLFVWIVVIVMMLIEWMRSSRLDTYKQQTYFVEIFGGLKDIWRCRSYLLLNFGRRAALITISMVCPFELIGVIIAFNVVQICYFGVMLWMRPFEAQSDGIIDMSNELFFTILSLLIIHFNEESRWNQIISSVFMWTIFTNALITTLVILSMISKLTYSCSDYSD